MHFDEAVRRFQTQLQADGRSPHTTAFYLRNLALLRCFLTASKRSHRVEALTPEILSRFITSPAIATRADGRPKKGASIDSQKMSLRSFCRYLVETDVIPSNPARLLKARRGTRRLPEILTETEKGRLLRTVACAPGKLARRDHMILHLFVDSGIRLDSLVGLDVADVRLAERAIVVRRMKGGGEVKKFLPAGLRHHLRKYLRALEREEPGCPALFRSNRGDRLSSRHIGRIVEHWTQAAGIEKRVSPHTLRRTFATHLYDQTRDLLLVQRALGHRHVATTQVYAQLSDRALETALERF